MRNAFIKIWLAILSRLKAELNLKQDPVTWSNLLVIWHTACQKIDNIYWFSYSKESWSARHITLPAAKFIKYATLVWPWSLLSLYMCLEKLFSELWLKVDQLGSRKFWCLPVVAIMKVQSNLFKLPPLVPDLCQATENPGLQKSPLK